MGAILEKIICVNKDKSSLFKLNYFSSLLITRVGEILVFKIGYSFTYFIQGVMLGLFLSYYAFLLTLEEYVLIATLFLLTWSIKPVYSFLIDKLNILATVFSLILVIFFLILPMTYIPIWMAILGGIALGLMDVSADGWLTMLSGEGVNPDFWTGIGFAARTTGFLLVVIFTILSNTISLHLLFMIVKSLGIILTIIVSVSFIRFRFKEKGDIKAVLRHFKENILLYLLLYIATSWGSAVFDVATKIYETRSILIEIIILTTIFAVMAQLLGRDWYIYKFTPASTIIFTIIGIISFLYGLNFLLELTVAFVASLSWPVYGIINEKASEVNSYPVFYTALLYGLSNIFDALYINTVTFIVPIYLHPLIYLILILPLMSILKREYCEKY